MATAMATRVEEARKTIAIWTRAGRMGTEVEPE